MYGDFPSRTRCISEFLACNLSERLSVAEKLIQTTQ
jgi:hypothetical protein